MRVTVPKSDWYICPECGHVDRDDTAAGFWEQGDDLWKCPKCGKNVVITPMHAITAMSSDWKINALRRWTKKAMGRAATIRRLVAEAATDGLILAAAAKLIADRDEILASIDMKLWRANQRLRQRKRTAAKMRNLLADSRELARLRAMLVEFHAAITVSNKGEWLSTFDRATKRNSVYDEARRLWEENKKNDSTTS